MATLRIPTAPVFPPLLEPARYKGAYGGRGSGKSHFFGELIVERCLVNPGTLAVCIREVQKSLLQSSKRLIETTGGSSYAIAIYPNASAAWLDQSCSGPRPILRFSS